MVPDSRCGWSRAFTVVRCTRHTKPTRQLTAWMRTAIDGTWNIDERQGVHHRVDEQTGIDTATTVSYTLTPLARIRACRVGLGDFLVLLGAGGSLRIGVFLVYHGFCTNA